MAGFLEYGTPKGGPTTPAPFIADTDPRGKTGSEMWDILQSERERAEAEEDAREQYAQENDFSAMNHIGRAIVQESLVANLLGKADNFIAEYDKDFDVEPLIDSTWPEWRQNAVREANNPEHAQRLIDRTQEQQLYEEEGNYLGGIGMATEMVGALLNPEVALLGAGEVKLLGKLGLTGLKAAIAGATIGSLSNAAQEAVIVSNNKSRTKLGIGVAGLFGAGFGAVGGLLPPAKEVAGLKSTLGNDLAGNWKINLEDAAAPSGWYAALPEPAKLDFMAETAEYDKLFPKRKALPGASIGLEGRASANPHTRRLHYLITEDASGTGGKQVAAPSAALLKERYLAAFRDTHITRAEAIKDWAKRQDSSVLKRWVPWDNSANAKFDDAVIQEVTYRRYPESRPAGHTPDPAVSKMADAFQAYQTGKAELLKAKNATGYDKLVVEPTYIPHRWDGIAMSRIANAISDTEVIAMLKRGILASREFERVDKYGHLGEKLTDEFKDKTAGNMAKAIYNRYSKRPDSANLGKSGWLRHADREELTSRAEAIINNEADLKHLLSALDGKDARRADELLSQIDVNLNITSGQYSLRDLIDTNLGSSLDTDMRHAAGRAAMAEVGFVDEDAFLDATKKAGRWNRENLNMDAAALEKSRTKDQALWRMMMGENLEANPNGDIAKVARGLREAATLASLNQVGFAQASETGKLVGALGVRQFLKQVPTFKNLVRTAKSGTLKDAFLHDIEAACGFRIGMDEIINHPMLLADEGGLTFTKAQQKGFMAGLQTVMHKGLHVQGYINGMNGLMKMQHRIHARGFFMQMCEDVEKTGLRASRLRRYADIGLSPEDLKAVSKELKKNAEYGQGWFGQDRVVDMGLQKFDPTLREKLVRALIKKQNQTIQRTMAGEQAWWMNTTLGKMVSQFRSFPLIAIEKQTVKDLKFCDIEAFTTLTATLGMSSAAYVAKTYANSFGLDKRKRKQYLKNRLSPEKIAAGAAAWAPQFNILPDVMSGLGELGLVNPFMYTYQKGQNYRDYNMGQGLSLSDIGPTGAYIDKAYKTVMGLGRVALTSEELSAQNFKYITGLIPFGNAIPIKGAADYLLRD